MSTDYFLNLILILAGLANFACIGAGIQIPKVLDWKNDLQKIHPFSRKIFLNYYFYVGLMIFSWGVISLFLRKELLAGGPLAIAILVIMLLFWLIRIVVDFFFFDATDWPKGKYFQFGHIILTGTFFCLVVAYSIVLSSLVF